jgi:hypothetical protein
MYYRVGGDQNLAEGKWYETGCVLLQSGSTSVQPFLAQIFRTAGEKLVRASRSSFLLEVCEIFFASAGDI